jgi:DNA/RNA-binding domain of Phe-tRNA-synthetase-like protein
VIRFSLDHPTLRLAAVSAGAVRCEPSSPDLVERMQVAAMCVRRDPAAFPEAVRSAIRDVLRVGGYKPSGRGKPASEFLQAAASEQGLPVVNNLVDINNLVSLGTALPISMFDADKLGTSVVVRFGRPGERYIFNVSGQSMDVTGIPVICRAATDEPAGNAVKDSMLAKVGAETRNILAVIYGSTKLGDGLLEGAARELQTLLAEFAFAQNCVWSISPG